MTELRLAPVYEETRDRIVALVRHPATGTSARVAETVVPACPGWRVRDVIAHVTGIYADIVGGNLQGGATDEWTAAQNPLKTKNASNLRKAADKRAQTSPRTDFGGVFGGRGGGGRHR